MKSPADIPFEELAEIAAKASRKANEDARAAGVVVAGIKLPAKKIRDRSRAVDAKSKKRA